MGVTFPAEIYEEKSLLIRDEAETGHYSEVYKQPACFYKRVAHNGELVERLVVVVASDLFKSATRVSGEMFARVMSPVRSDGRQVYLICGLVSAPVGLFNVEQLYPVVGWHFSTGIRFTLYPRPHIGGKCTAGMPIEEALAAPIWS